MSYDREINFVKRLLENLQIQFRYLSKSSPMTNEKALGLQHILNYEYDHGKLLQELELQCKPNTIYKIFTPLLCHYALFQIPNSKPVVYAYIGPYSLNEITKQDILHIANQFHVAPGHLQQIEKFYETIPKLSDENILMSILYTLGEYLWNGSDNFTLKSIRDLSSLNATPVTPLPDIQTQEEALLSMQLLEKRYESEHNLIHAVSMGQTHKAELYFSQLSTRQFQRRNSDPVRDTKNNGIILNTLLRIAADRAGVHPIHMDEISSKYARKIELIPSSAAGVALMKEMIHKYCLLVKNHSLKGYSFLVRKVITRINADLTADLSLKAQAEALNVNASYLSALFKKETGTTLTEYVNRKRIEHAILLLNTTDMQIQVIAQYCGISDVNYFTKTFKKIIGKTPTEYRELITILH